MESKLGSTGKKKLLGQARGEWILRVWWMALWGESGRNKIILGRKDGILDHGDGCVEYTCVRNLGARLSMCDLVVMEGREVSRKTPAFLFYTNRMDQGVVIKRNLRGLLALERKLASSVLS